MARAQVVGANILALRCRLPACQPTRVTLAIIHIPHCADVCRATDSDGAFTRPAGSDPLRLLAAPQQNFPGIGNILQRVGFEHDEVRALSRL